MALFVILLVLTISACHVSADRVTADTELVLAFMIHRHGDRTPVVGSIDTVSAAIDVDAAQKLIAPLGYGQLTNQGIQRAYRTGQFIRRRYNDLLAETFNRSEIYIRSTDSTRAKMTILSALAAVYPAVGDTWSDEINWVPVPYTTLPPKYDFNLFAANCPIYTDEFNVLFSGSSPAMDKYASLLNKLTDILEYDVSATSLSVYSIYDVFVSLNNLGYDLGADILNLMPELKMAAGDAADVIFNVEENLSYQAGPLLNQFFEVAAAVIAGNETRRIWVYSAHDINVYSFESITQIANKQGAPRYASLYSLELRRVRNTGRYVVLPVYLPTPEEPEIYLQVSGCRGLLCDYDTFFDITSPYALTEDAWRIKCGFTNDLVVDESAFD